MDKQQKIDFILAQIEDPVKLQHLIKTMITNAIQQVEEERINVIYTILSE